MLRDMTGSRVALVTGAARRVGRAIVQRLAADGFDIAFTYLRSREEADDLIKEVEKVDRACLAIGVDLSRPEEAIGTIESEFHRRFTRLDLLVNNASAYL